MEKFIARMEGSLPRKFPFGPALSVRRRRTREEAMREGMWLGLRLTEAGVSRSEFRSKHGGWPPEFQDAVAESVAEGLLEESDDGDRIRLTQRGRLLGNRVFQKFV
jgi:oxygen-independent coproporphyrinogen-3 oxidase